MPVYNYRRLSKPLPFQKMCLSSIKSSISSPPPPPPPSSSTERKPADDSALLSMTIRDTFSGLISLEIGSVLQRQSSTGAAEKEEKEEEEESAQTNGGSKFGQLENIAER